MGTLEAATALAAALRGCATLRDVELCGVIWGPGPAGAEAFFGGLGGFGEGGAAGTGAGAGRGAVSRCALQSLKMTSIPVDEDAAAALGSSLRSGALPALRSLEFSGREVKGDALASELADALIALGSTAALRHLALRVAVRDSGARRLRGRKGSPQHPEAQPNSIHATLRVLISLFLCDAVQGRWSSRER